MTATGLEDQLRPAFRPSYLFPTRLLAAPIGLGVPIRYQYVSVICACPR